MPIVTAILLGLGLLIAGCAGVDIKPGDRSHARREVPPGPGILTGQQGEFTLFRSDDSSDDDDEANSDQDPLEKPKT